MKNSILFQLTTVVAFTASLLGPAAAQPISAPSGGTYPNWTGASYPFPQHLTTMLLHLDEAALAMARTAQKSAKNENVKKLAADVVAERSRDVQTMRSEYNKRYGQTPPVWPSPQSGRGAYGPGMMGGGYGPGMMGGSGTVGGNGSWYGPMMGYGDSYQMMMGGQSNWWGSTNADDGFVQALMRLDAMEISMATLGLSSSDPDTKKLARSIVSARTNELSGLSKNIK